MLQIISAFRLFAEGSSPPTQTLPEPVRQVALMALLGIALLGMLMIVATLLGGHWVRRWGDRIRGRAVPQDVLIPRKHTPFSGEYSGEEANDGETRKEFETKVEKKRET